MVKSSKVVFRIKEPRIICVAFLLELRVMKIVLNIMLSCVLLLSSVANANEKTPEQLKNPVVLVNKLIEEKQFSEAEQFIRWLSTTIYKRNKNIVDT